MQIRRKTAAGSGSLPVVQLVVRQLPYYGLVRPVHESWVAVSARSIQGAAVGRIRYLLSPIFDRIYIDELHIEPEFHRQGYATSLLVQIVKACSTAGHRLPITALHEFGSASPFWDALRAGRIPGLNVTRDVRASEWEAEKWRWQAILIASA